MVCQIRQSIMTQPASESHKQSLDSLSEKEQSLDSLTEKERKEFQVFGRAITDLIEPQKSQETNKEKAEKQHKRCLKWKEKMLNSSPIITFLTEKIKGLSRENIMFDNYIQCRPCETNRSGAFSPTNGILLCENKLESKSHLEDTLAHQLVHAFDQATVKNLDWRKNLNHLACSEIRAVNLSGECRFTREIRRGYFAVAKHHQDCVKRRAILGIREARPEVSTEQAEMAVLNAWMFCFPDTAPFDEIY